MLILVCWVFTHLYNFHINEQNKPASYIHVSPAKKKKIKKMEHVSDTRDMNTEGSRYEQEGYAEPRICLALSIIIKSYKLC